MLHILRLVCLLACLIPSVAFAKFTPVPLLNDLNRPDLTVNLQPTYRVKTLWFNDLSRIAIRNAVTAWADAAKDPNFITLSDDSPNIFITSIPLEEGLYGVAFPFASNTCVITVHSGMAYNIPLYIHEIGHCLGFAHNTEDQKSVMQPHTLQPKFAVDKKTAKSLRWLLARLV